MRKIVTHMLLTLAGGIVFLNAAGVAAYVQVGVPLDQLPQDHEYQRQIRAFMATLTEKDFEVEARKFSVGPVRDMDHLYRMWLLSLDIPGIGAAALPAASYTLKALESGTGIMLPAGPSESEMLSWLANWDYPGNPYHGSRAIKLRAFVLAAVDLEMLDTMYEKDPRDNDRADYLGGNLIWIGYTYHVVKDALPAYARAAFEAGIKKQVLRLNQWGPKGLMTDMDLFAPVGLAYIAQTSSDRELKKVAKDYSHRLFTDLRFFHPAGYFVDNDCFDTSYNGISLYFGTRAALASKWSFARKAIDKAFRLRAHLCFPDPDGTFHGPSEMSSRTSADPPHDQWDFAHRPYAAAMVTDEALYLAPLPAENRIKAAPAAAIHSLNQQMAKTPALKPRAWLESHWSRGVNFAYEHYRRGTYAKVLELKVKNSPLTKPLFQRDENFIHEFDKAFVIARFDDYALAIHTGPVGRPVGYNGSPYGFGGGQLCAFWTPQSGSVILGRRRGVQGGVFDTIDDWPLWPNHAVTGITAGGEVLSSSRIQRPDLAIRIRRGKAEVRASGVIPKYNREKTAAGPSGLRYERQFTAAPDGLTIETSLASDGRDSLAELYETIPVFLRELGAQRKATPTEIEFRVGDQWNPATAEFQDEIGAVRLRRFGGAVLIVFKHPRRAKLSPADWVDGYQTQASCRTILVDLLEAGDRPQLLKAATVSYVISAVAAHPEHP